MEGQLSVNAMPLQFNPSCSRLSAPGGGSGMTARGPGQTQSPASRQRGCGGLTSSSFFQSPKRFADRPSLTIPQTYSVAARADAVGERPAPTHSERSPCERVLRWEFADQQVSRDRRASVHLLHKERHIRCPALITHIACPLGRHWSCVRPRFTADD
jgi:hypothetical protein